MAKRHTPHEEHVDESWLIPYADILTLLLALFIVLFASSTIDQKKYEAMASAFSTEFGGIPPYTEVGGNPGGAMADIDPGEAAEQMVEQKFNTLYESLVSIIEAKQYDELIEVVRDGNLITLRFRDSVLFYPDSPEFVPDGLGILDNLSNVIAQLESAIGFVAIEGHTANPEGVNLDQRATEFSWRLSNDRALAVLRHFSQDVNFPERKMYCTGRSHFDPIDNNDIARNRRVEIKITKLVPNATATSEQAEAVDSADPSGEGEHH